MKNQQDKFNNDYQNLEPNISKKIKIEDSHIKTSHFNKANNPKTLENLPLNTQLNILWDC
jgi:hypothetical protein